MLKIFKTLFSVISLCLLCKPLQADEVNSFWQGFQNSGYSSINLSVPRSDTTQLKLNEVSWFLSWDNNTRFKFFSELEVENPATLYANRGLTGQGSTLDLERLYIDYNVNEKSNVRVGRFLTPIGRWNQLHAPPLVWTASRPLVTLRMFPYGINGAMMFGNVFINQTAIEYQIFAEAVKDQYQHNYEPIFKDVKGGRVAFNNVLGFGGENAGLNSIGLNVMTYRKDMPGSPLYRLYGLDFLIEFDRWEFSGEAYLRKTVKGDDGGSGAYIQSAYSLGNEWYWITRLENYRATDESNAKRWVQGLTKRLTPNQLLKFEFIGGSAEYQDVPRGFVTSFAVMF